MDDATERDVLEELASLPTMAHQTVSPDGTEIALYYDDTGRNELHVIDVETGERTQWSDGEVPRNARWHVAWDADGDRIFFHLDEDGNEQNDVHAIARDGTVEPVVTGEGQTIVHDVGPDGRWLYFGSSRDGQMNCYRHDLETGDTVKLTDYDRAIWQSHVSPDGYEIAYSTNETEDFDNRDAYVAHADGSDPRNLEIGAVGAEAGPAGWGPNGNRLLVADNTEDLSRAGVYDLGDDAVTWLGEGAYEEGPIEFVDASTVLASRDRGALTVPVVYDLETGGGRELDLPEGVASFGTTSRRKATLSDGRVVYQHTTPTRRPALLAYDLDADEIETLLPAEYGPFSPEDFADATYFTFESDCVPDTRQAAVEHDPYDELEIGALLYDPGDHPAPLIVNPHGGPRYRDEKSFDLFTQVLATRGYAVLQVNYRGSSGRGREFVERLYDDWGGAEQGDVATGVEYALETFEWLSEDRVAVFGGSYGGYSAYWQLVQYPDRYDAGIAWIGLTDLTDMYETTMPHYRTELMEKNLGTPEENPDLYEERSPIEYVENLDAPLLMVHGVNDRRVPISQARLFREALLEAGFEEGAEGDFEYRELGEEGHASSDQAQKLRMFRLLADFLDRRFQPE